MVTFLFASILLIGLLAAIFYFWQRPSQHKLNPFASEAMPLPPTESLGLFSDSESNEAVTAQIEAAAAAAAREYLAGLIARAREDDKSALQDASAHSDQATYEEVLNCFVGQADSDSKLLSLVSYVVGNDLHVNKQLADAIIESWKLSPDRPSTAKMLHIAALSDDVPTYQRATETALQYWLAGRLSDTSPVELRTLLDGEFWVLSSTARNTGAGFILKRTLASARRELDRAARLHK